LLAFAVPGLLMLACSGLQRLETGLTGGSVSAAEVSRMLDRQTGRAEPGDRPEGAHVGPGVHRPLPQPDAARSSRPASTTRMFVHHQAKSSFRPTRSADPV